MHLSKKLTLAIFLFSGLATSISAADKSGGSILNAEQVARMSCSAAAEQLRVRVQLSRQLGYAYLQTYQELSDVYTSWGDKLTNLKSLREAPAIGTFFLDSAVTTQKAISQSSKVVEDLNLETSLLLDRVVGCVKK